MMETWKETIQQHRLEMQKKSSQPSDRMCRVVPSELFACSSILF
jgi:hypothetical protein